MRRVRVLSFTVLSSSIGLLSTLAAAQGTATDYARSEGLRARIDGLVIDAAEPPIWIGRGAAEFVYRKSVKGGRHVRDDRRGDAREAVRRSIMTDLRRRSMRSSSERRDPRSPA